jgi:hypothetical protein
MPCLFLVIFNYIGNFCTARKKLLDQANNALYRKIRNLAILIDLQLELFDSLITPILVYSCEVWGFENKQGIEKMHLQYCKRILNLRSRTPNFVVFGEIGRFPVEIIITLQIALIVSQSGWLSFLFFCIEHIMFYLPDLTISFELHKNFHYN